MPSMPQPRAPTSQSPTSPFSQTHGTRHTLGPVCWITGQMSYIPNNAIPFGYENDLDPAQLYVGKLQYKGEWYAGKVGQELSGIDIAYKGKEVGSSARYSVLCGDSTCFAWLLVPEGKSFEGDKSIVPGGWALVSVGTKATGAKVFIAAVDYYGGRQIGEVLCGKKVASIPFGGSEILITPFYVLMIKEEKLPELTDTEQSTV
ncbi:hypothetical protein BOTBODRAFT_225325 [Botryobasidium botryosum FD-172 SS1]|uniref:Uncharacterized protein n=1 Tax=Botryobasidium botryosum (strain FD-172 SS1) TaxID=930990 RepID=A0A067MNI3_BOTB1|nr:hypothetical protein BOTBODRAFT_225325 [Botryobasidium botryosum FD-172 SS1]